MCFEKNKILKNWVKLRMLQRRFFTQVLIEPLLKKGSVKSIKPIYHLTRLLMGSLKIFCFISVATTDCVLHALVYDAVDVNKIIAISSIKLPSHAYVQVTAGLILYLG